jgi:hypothetical protein
VSQWQNGAPRCRLLSHLLGLKAAHDARDCTAFSPVLEGFIYYDLMMYSDKCQIEVDVVIANRLSQQSLPMGSMAEHTPPLP